MTSKRIYSAMAAVLGVVILSSTLAHAATGTPLTLEKVVTLITDALNILMGLAVTVTVAIMVYGGYQMAFSRGVQKAFDDGKATLTNAIIGLIVILGVGIIINTISDFAIDPTSITR